MFCLGFIINITSDSTLLSLKANKEGKKREESIKKINDEQAKTSYDIPYGGLFEYVSCANYCKYDALLLLMIVR